MIPVLLDTGCIVALLDRSERNHEKCVSAVPSLHGALLTCEAVIAESCYLLRNVPGAAAAILDNVAQGIFRISFSLAPSSKRVSKLLKKYADVPMDFADACLVDMAWQHGTPRILTLDRDFRIYRWGRNRPFDLILDV